MTYTLDILIDAPLELCAKKFSITDNMKYWERGLISIEHLSGTPSTLGAKMKIRVNNGKHGLTAVETITHINFPQEIHCSYTTEGMDNIQENYFTEVANNCTKWTCINEYMPLNLIMRLRLLLLPKSYKKHSFRYMKDFKNYVEKGISIADA